MKKLIYKIEGFLNQYNLETNEMDKISTPIEIIVRNPTNENIESAKQIALNGEYTIEDDGAEETAAISAEERIAALEEALTLLLEGATE